MVKSYDLIVVGLGVMGTAALYQAARRGLSVLGLEQHEELGHTFGSSHGETRVIRQAYFEHPDYVPLIQDAWNEWRQLEQLSGEELLIQTGGIMMGLPSSEVVSGAIEAARLHHLPYELLDSKEVNRKYPHFHLAPDEVGVFEQLAGYVMAERSIHAMANQAQKMGADILTGTAVTDIINAENGDVEVHTNDDMYRSSTVILTAGPWIGEWLPKHTLSVERQVLFWLDSPDLANLCDYPIFIHEVPGTNQHTYGFPYIQRQGFKVARHHGGETTTVDGVHRVVTDADEADLRANLAFLPDAASAPVRDGQVCLYTNTHDSNFILGHHPSYKNMVVGAGFSGHGFKFAPTIGSILVDLAIHKQGTGLELFSPLREGIWCETVG